MSWILSANRSGARILERQGQALTLIETVPHPAGRLHDRDVDSDRGGRTFDRVGGGRHALETAESPHEHDARNFARQLGALLRAQRLSHKFERLILVAEPHFLGLLRDELDEATSRTVVATVPHDLEQVPLHELNTHLPAP